MNGQYNPQQREFIDEVDTGCCVIAIPGSGKTQTCVAKLAYLLNGHLGGRWSAPKRAMAVTFTAEAAKELKARTKSMIGEAAEDRLQAGTFHSLFLAALKRVGSEVASRRIASTGQAEQYRDRALEANMTEWHKAETVEAKDRLRSLFERARCVKDDPYGMAAAKGDEDRQRSAQLASAVQYYKDTMRKARLLDFGMILEESLAYMQSADGEDIERTPQYHEDRRKAAARGEDTSHAYEKAYKFIAADHVIADECQDQDYYQFELLMQIADAGVIVDVVGDDDQAIYAFRAARGYEGMQEFMERTGARLIVLDTNYRCRTEVLELADQIIGQNRDRTHKVLQGKRGYGAEVTLDCELDGAAEIARLHDAIRAHLELEDRGAKPRRTRAVIARINRILDEVQVALQAVKIKTDRPGGDDLWSIQPVCFYLEMLEGLAKGTAYGLDESLYWAGVRPETVDLDSMTMAIGNPGEGDAQLVEKLNETLRLCRGKARSQDKETGDEVISRVYEWFVMAAAKRSGSDEEERAAVRKLRMAARILGGDECALAAEQRAGVQEKWSSTNSIRGMTGAVMDRVQAARRLDRTGQGDEAAVKLLSMHASKGTEFDQCWVVGLDDECIPGTKVEYAPNRQAAIEEERRLLYVAVTRARDALHLSWSARPIARERTKKENRAPAKESRFLTELSRRPPPSEQVAVKRGFRLRV